MSILIDLEGIGHTFDITSNPDYLILQDEQVILMRWEDGHVYGYRVTGEDFGEYTFEYLSDAEVSALDFVLADFSPVGHYGDSDDYDDGMDGDFDSAMASAGWGTDEDYGCYGGDDW